MAVDVPTVDDIFTRFPTLEAEEDLVAAILPEAIAQVDERWRTQDQKIAIMYLVAHMVTVEANAGGGADGAGVSVGNIASESLGPMSVSYKDSGSAAGSVSDYQSTVYGKQFQALLRKNFPGIIVAE